MAQGDYINIAAPSSLMGLTWEREGQVTAARFTGSSAATPFLSGFSALLLSYCPELTRDQLFNLLTRYASNPDLTLKPYLGAGVVDVSATWDATVKFCPAQKTKVYHQPLK